MVSLAYSLIFIGNEAILIYLLLLVNEQLIVV